MLLRVRGDDVSHPRSAVAVADVHPAEARVGEAVALALSLLRLRRPGRRGGARGNRRVDPANVRRSGVEQGHGRKDGTALERGPRGLGRAEGLDLNRRRSAT